MLVSHASPLYVCTFTAARLVTGFRPQTPESWQAVPHGAARGAGEGGREAQRPTVWGAESSRPGLLAAWHVSDSHVCHSSFPCVWKTQTSLVPGRSSL